MTAIDEDTAVIRVRAVSESINSNYDTIRHLTPRPSDCLFHVTAPGYPRQNRTSRLGYEKLGDLFGDCLVVHRNLALFGDFRFKSRHSSFTHVNTCKKAPWIASKGQNWVQGLDLNQRPSGYEPDELPGCSTLQQGEAQRAPHPIACQRLFGFLRTSHLPVARAFPVFDRSAS